MPKRRQRNSIPTPIIKSTSDNAISTKSSTLSSYDTTNLTSNGGGNLFNGGDENFKLSLKEQQQLDRNNFLAAQTKDQLKIECRKRGQKTTGTKTELLQRLGFKMIQPQKPQASLELDSSPKTTSNNNAKLTRSGQNKMVSSSSESAVGTSIKQSPSNGVKSTASFLRKQSARDREKERAERGKIVLWRHPIMTVKYCALESVTLLQTYGKKLLDYKITLVALLVLVSIITSLYHVPGRHQILIDVIRTNMWFITYWVGLGVLSSVGLGTGLHTFLLYLGPHIASVTLASYECNSLDFPQPPYPDDIICPEKTDPNFIPSLWNIMSKVRFEAFLWGAGTALGELPPYFMARAARLSGYDPDDDEELQEFEELKKKQEQGVDLNILDRAKLAMEKVVERVGFLGILACASIPNPLFDLAGITCGHFLVPFWTFFGATLIGKAVIKMHIQKIFVIIAFNELLIERAVDTLGSIPIIGKRAQAPFKSFLKNQKTKLHRGTKAAPTKPNMIAIIFEKIVIVMIVYFIISIINSLAQNYHKRIHKKTGKVLRKAAKD